MIHPSRPFRFGVLLETRADTTLGEPIDDARRAEDAGCSIVLGALAAHAAEGVTEDEVAESPHYLYGDTERMLDHLLANRARWGVSYLVVKPAQLVSRAPVIGRLAGR